jgi:transketolase
VLADAPGRKPEVILIASGSEVNLALQAHEQLVAEGIRSRVVSMPSWDIFEKPTAGIRDRVLLSGMKARVAIEQASTFRWARYVGTTGRIIGMHTFRASAPLKELQKRLGFEPNQIVTAAKEQLAINA